METLHTYEDKSYGIGHKSADCPCGAAREVVRKPIARGRGGRHQGYSQKVIYRHKSLKAE